MLRFLLRLMGQSLLVLFISFTLLFILLRGLGDPAHILLGQRSDRVALEAIRRQLHLDKPLWQQYLYAWAEWLPYRDGQWRMPLLGTSYLYGRSVAALYAERFPATVLLAMAALLIAVILGIGGGLWQSVRPSKLLQGLSLLLLSLPGYVVGLMLVALLAIEWGRWTGLPPTGYILTYDSSCDCLLYQWRALVLPAFALSLRPAAYLFQLTSEEARLLLQKDFIRAARARGKPFWRILLSDVLRNLFPPIITALTQWLAGILTGALFIEELFDWPGVGRLLFSALISSDFPLLIGIAQLSTLIFILLNAMSELLGWWSDPRLRQQEVHTFAS
ncbi:MAG: ABC transporter permease [Bacteroidia bacterium]|nr:ABC transporter permease [Bacteroidia bacterium]MDW8014390.1 ABC transporter permease [Bacteroidia bacterium]